MNKALLLSLLFGASGFFLGDQLGYAPEEGVTLIHTFEASSSSSLVSMSLEVDGELVREVGADELEGALERESLERIQIRDEIESVEGGRATEFTRTFQELLQESTERSGDAQQSSSSKSDLEGVAVEFSWDSDAEEFDVRFFDEDSELDELLIEALHDDVDLRSLLPEDSVEPGDEWELEDPAAYLPLMWPGGLLGFYDVEADGPDAASREGNAEVIENLEVQCTVTYEGQEEREGIRVALLSVSMEIESGTESEVEPEEGPAYTLEILLERSIEGEVLWDLEHGHLFSASFEGDVRTLIRQAATITNPDTDEDFDVLDSKVLEGSISYTIGVERE